MIKKRRTDVGMILQALRKSVDSLTDEEYQQLLNGRGSFRFVSGNNSPIRKQLSKSIIPTENISLLALDLDKARTREEARGILHQNPSIPLRDNLVQLAKILNVHTNKQDTRQDIENKIVESVVGARLRSKAIFGINFSKSS